MFGRAYFGGSYFGPSYFGAGADQLAPPVFFGPIGTIRANFDTGTKTVNFGGAYFGGATSYTIDPAVEAGWTFSGVTGVMVIDTSVEDVFGPYTITAVNADGDVDSNAFLIEVREQTAGVDTGIVRNDGPSDIAIDDDDLVAPGTLINQQGSLV